MRRAGIPPHGVERLKGFAAATPHAKGESEAGNEARRDHESSEPTQIAGDHETDGESTARGERDQNACNPTAGNWRCKAWGAEKMSEPVA